MQRWHRIWLILIPFLGGASAPHETATWVQSFVIHQWLWTDFESLQQQSKSVSPTTALQIAQRAQLALTQSKTAGQPLEESSAPIPWSRWLPKTHAAARLDLAALLEQDPELKGIKNLYQPTGPLPSCALSQPRLRDPIVMATILAATLEQMPQGDQECLAIQSTQWTNAARQRLMEQVQLTDAARRAPLVTLLLAQWLTHESHLAEALQTLFPLLQTHPEYRPLYQLGQMVAARRQRAPGQVSLRNP